MLGCEELSSLLVFLSHWLCVIFTSELVRPLPLTRFVGVNRRPNSSKERKELTEECSQPIALPCYFICQLKGTDTTYLY